MTVKKPMYEFLEGIAKSPRPQKGWILVSRALTGAEPTMGTVPQNGSDLGLVVLCACCAWASLHSAPLSCSAPTHVPIPRSLNSTPAVQRRCILERILSAPCHALRCQAAQPGSASNGTFLPSPAFLSACLIAVCSVIVQSWSTG